MNKQVQLCVTMDLRDFAAFEDLTSELGIEMYDEKIIDQAKAKPVARKRQKKAIHMATEVWDSIMEYDPDKSTYDQIRAQLISEFGGHNVPSTETIRRVYCGKVKRPNRSLIK